MKKTTTAAVAHCPTTSAASAPTVIRVWAVTRFRMAARVTLRRAGARKPADGRGSARAHLRRRARVSRPLHGLRDRRQVDAMRVELNDGLLRGQGDVHQRHAGGGGDGPRDGGPARLATPAP